MLLCRCPLQYSDFGKNPRSWTSLTTTAPWEERMARCAAPCEFNFAIYSSLPKNAMYAGVIHADFTLLVWCPYCCSHLLPSEVTPCCKTGTAGGQDGRRTDEWRDELEEAQEREGCYFHMKVLWISPQAFCQKTVDFHWSRITFNFGK